MNMDRFHPVWNRVYQDKHTGAWIVVYRGDVLTPTFQSEGAAKIYLTEVQEGRRTAEYAYEPKRE